MLLISSVNAQLENLVTAFSTYQIPAAECVGIQHESGSRIFIPSNAFNLNGFNKPDSLTLFYKEFFTTLDFLANNLDMHFKNTFIASGGMFELYVKLNDEIVPLNNNKEIRVEFIKKNDIAVFDEFAYDDLNKAWDKNTNYTDEEVVDDWNSNPCMEDGRIDTTTVIDLITLLPVQKIVAEECDFNTLFQTMNVPHYGLFNYDYLLNFEEAVPIAVNFRIKEVNKKMSINLPSEDKIYVVYDDINSLIYYDKDDFKENFRLLPNKTFKIFHLNENGKVATWKMPDDFNLEDLRNTEYTFELISSRKTVESLDELKDFTGI